MNLLDGLKYYKESSASYWQFTLERGGDAIADDTHLAEEAGRLTCCLKTHRSPETHAAQPAPHAFSRVPRSFSSPAISRSW